MTTPKFRTQSTRHRVQVSFPAQGRTKQSFKDECDINTVMRKYQQTGQLPDAIRRDGRYGDFSSVKSFQDALETVRHAEEQFSMLSANVRKEFENDPAAFLAFTSDPNNLERMVELGLAERRETRVEGDPAPSPASSSKKAGKAPTTPPKASEPAEE